MNAEATTEAGLAWSDRYLLGYAPMDAHHREFINSLNGLAAATSGDLPVALDRFIKEAEAHFQDENDWMTKHDFPPRDCHIREHQAVLDTLYEARGLVAIGKTDFLPGLIAALTAWFPGHADYLDSALAQWMLKRRLGGVPIVLKRAVV